MAWGKRAILVMIAVALAPCVAFAGALAVAEIAESNQTVKMLFPQMSAPHTLPELILFALPIFGVVGAPVICLIVEAWWLGFERSALKRLLLGASASSRNDLFYLLLRGSGAVHAIAFVLSLGTVFAIAGWIYHQTDFGLMHHAPFLAQLATFTLVNSFLFYWSHRLMHTPWLWEFHKVHHSAEEMNVVQPIRNHPFDIGLMAIIYAAPIALLGIAPLPATIYYAANSIYQCLVHSGIDMPSRALGVVIVTSNMHRVHHSNESRHWGRNFGMLTIWDWLFGTYAPPAFEPLRYGVDTQADFNTGNYFGELVAVVARALRRVRHMRSLVRNHAA